MKYFNITLVIRGKKNIKLIKATHKIEAVSLIKQQFPQSIVIKTEETSAPLEDMFTIWFLKLKKSFKVSIPINEKIATIRQIAVMADAGIAINDILKDIGDNTDNKELQEIYLKINHDINAGNSISDAMYVHTKSLGHLTVAMTDLGEKTGNIAISYHKLADILENTRDNSEKFKKAIRGSLITLTVLAIAFIILIMVVVPKFKDIFSRFKTELPLPTQILLKLEWLFSHYGIYILCLFLSVILLIRYMYKNDKVMKLKLDMVLIHPKFYLINKAILLSTMHRYTLVLGELLKSGIPITEALDTAVGMVENSAIKQKLLTVNKNINRGMSLTQSFELTGLYKGMLIQMIKAGESSATLDMMLEKITAYYDREFQNLIDNISTFIEPIIMFFMAGLVLLMALGIFMPMWDLGSVVK